MQLELLNTYRLKSKNMFVSLAYSYFNLNLMSCTFVNAGHLPPVHFSRPEDKVKEWRTGGVVLGQFPGFEYQCETVELSPGDKILFYTDGVSESENEDSELYGRARVSQFVLDNAQLPAQEFTKKLLREVEAFRFVDANTQIDDTTVLVVEIK